jgi:hypothetical protein
MTSNQQRLPSACWAKRRDHLTCRDLERLDREGTVPVDELFHLSDF